MTAGYTVEWADHVPTPKDGEIVVAEALLPMLFWRGLEIRRVTEVPLAPVERFLLEAVGRVRTLTAALVTEVTDLSAETVAAVADGLTEPGLLTREHDGWRAEPGPIADALERGTLHLSQRDTCSIVFLPHSEEAVAFGAPLQGRRRRSGPLSVPSDPPDADLAPLDPAHVGRPVPAFLNDLLDQGLIARLDGIAEFATGADDPFLPATALAYRASGVVRRTAPEVDLRIHSGQEPTRLDLTGATALTNHWRRMAGFAEDPPGPGLMAAALGCAADDLTVGEVVAGRRELLLSEKAARAVAERHSLDTRGGFHVRDELSIIAIGVVFRPADGEAEALFALDRAAARVGKARKFEAVCAEFGVTQEALTDRLWQLSRYDTIYALREDEDFRYD
ncbi:hypothetical protein [Herbidospora sp. RD11066]